MYMYIAVHVLYSYNVLLYTVKCGMHFTFYIVHVHV